MHTLHLAMEFIARNWTPFWYSVTCAIFSILFLYVYGESRGKRRLPPGPPSWPLVGNLLALEQNVHECLFNLAKTYGPLMTFGFGMKTTVVVSSSSMAKQILKDNDQTFANRSIPSAARIIAYDASDILWSPYGPRWRLLRKICVKELFSPKSLEALHHLRREQVCRTIQSIYEESMNSEAVNVGSKAFLTSLNLITNMLWSTNSFDQASARGMEFKKLNGDLVYLLGVPNVSDLFPFLKALDLQGVNRRMMEVFRRFDGLFDSIIEERLSGTNKHNNKGSQGKDFLEFLLDLKNGTHIDGESISITMKDVKVLLMDMLTGSTDTTANTVEWAMAELLKQPKIMKKAQKELEDVVGIEQRVEECHLTQLPYLEAIVKEVLRLHPALPLLAPHCPDKACQIGGFVIPKGTQVLVNVWAIQRDPTVWKEPLVFDPDRFVDSKWDYNGQELEYFPFGSGRRICAGLSLATRMVHYTLASLIHSFHWSLPSHHKLDMSEKYGIVLRKAVPLMAIPKPRLLRDDLYDFSV
eukprot:Gb_15030 [translate_table: standard]